MGITRHVAVHSKLKVLYSHVDGSDSQMDGTIEPMEDDQEEQPMEDVTENEAAINRDEESSLGIPVRDQVCP